MVALIANNKIYTSIGVFNENFQKTVLKRRIRLVIFSLRPSTVVDGPLHTKSIM